MATYDYRCTDPLCSKLREDEHSMTGFKEHHPPCLTCGSSCDYEFNPTVFQFAMKDGPSGVSPSKAIRINQQMQKKSERVGKRQEERYGHLRKGVVPNYQGEQTETWREAQSLAISDKERLSAEGKDSLAVASTYKEKIAKEDPKAKIVG